MELFHNNAYHKDMFSEINTIFLIIFTGFYQIIHSNFITYLVILLLCLYILKWLWHTSIKPKSKKKKSLLITAAYYMAFFSFFAYTLWFIVFHFHTFRFLP